MTDIAQIALAVQFSPTTAQIRHRNEFWAQPGVEVPPECDLATALKLAPSRAVSRSLERSWTTPGFQDWFMHPQWEQEEAHRLLMLGMRRVSEVLRDSSDSDMIIKAAKEARELHTRVTAQAKDKREFADKAVQEMSPDELREFIRRNTAALK